MARLTFALRMLKDRWNRECSLCPYCEARFSIRLQRKWMLIEARRCLHCGLIYRWPTDPANGVRNFYENNYDGQQATDLPEPTELERMASQDFACTQFDKHNRVVFLNRTLGATGGRRLLDFGCSWGYSAWQYQAMGYVASGFELDRQRTRYGREHLRLDIRSNLDDFRDAKFDVILADHSLEHVPRPGATLENLAKLAANPSALVVFVPNGSCRVARRLGASWGPLIGEAHTVAFTVEWFARNLARYGWNAAFYGSDGAPLQLGEYLTENDEICVVARSSAH